MYPVVSGRSRRREMLTVLTERMKPARNGAVHRIGSLRDRERACPTCRARGHGARLVRVGGGYCVDRGQPPRGTRAEAGEPELESNRPRRRDGTHVIEGTRRISSVSPERGSFGNSLLNGML